MRRWLIRVFVAVSAMITFAFVAPLAVLIRTTAEDRAIDSARADAAAVVPALVADSSAAQVASAVGATTSGVEQQPDTETELVPGVHFLPTPGHTRGSACILVDDTWLFTGDTLCWSRAHRRLHAFRSACWYDWGELTRSITSLRGRRFRWVLPGHGAPAQLDPNGVDAELDTLLHWMAQVALGDAYLQLGRPTDAMRVFGMFVKRKQRIASLDRYDRRVAYQLGQLYLKADRPTDAVSTLEFALQALGGGLREDVQIEFL